jgi:hypothetical protein
MVVDSRIQRGAHAPAEHGIPPASFELHAIPAAGFMAWLRGNPRWDGHSNPAACRATSAVSRPFCRFLYSAFEFCF